MRELRLEHRHLQDLVALLLAAGESGVHGAVQHRRIHVDELELLLHEIRELERIDLFLAARLADLVVRRAQEVRVRDARNLHRILEREEDARLRALFGRHREKILAVVRHGAAGDLVRRIARQHLRERALAGAVRAHDGVDFAGFDGEIDAL